MARLFTKQEICAYIAKDTIPYEPYIELRKLKRPKFNDYTIKIFTTFDNLLESLKGKEIGILQHLNKGYDLILMSDLPESGPEERAMYLKKQNDQLEYLVITPEGEQFEGLLDISMPELTKESLSQHKDAILDETSKRGHTLKDSSLSNDLYFCVRYYNNFIGSRGYLNLKELEIAEPLSFSEKVKDKGFLDFLRTKISEKEWARERGQLDYQQYGLLIANHSEEYCKLFSFLSLDMVYHNCEDSTREHPVELERLNEEEVLFINETINKFSSSCGKNIDPINSIDDFRHLAQEINSHKENSELGLTRVLVESRESVYIKQIEKYHELLNGQLEILIAEGKVIRLAEDIYRLPKRFSSTINMWEYDKNYKDKMIYTVSARVLDSIGRDVSTIWFKDRENLCSGDVRIYKYEQAINHAIKDALYRNEVKLHDQETWKSIECSHDGDYQNWHRLYWDEVGMALGKMGIFFPEAKAVYGDFENTGTETQATSGGPRQISDEPTITEAEKRNIAIRKFILGFLKKEYDNKLGRFQLPDRKELKKALIKEYCFEFKEWDDSISSSHAQGKVVYYEFSKGVCFVALENKKPNKPVPTSISKAKMTDGLKKETLKFCVKEGLLSPGAWFFEKGKDNYEGFVGADGSQLHRIIAWEALASDLSGECEQSPEFKEKYTNLLNRLKKEAETKGRNKEKTE